MLAATAGPEVYNRMYGATVDPTVFDTPEVRKAIEIVRAFSNEATPESENRPWNETTNTVIAGKALMHIMGDWMKGEWLSAGPTCADGANIRGESVDCTPSPPCGRRCPKGG